MVKQVPPLKQVVKHVVAANGIDATNSNEAENSKEKRPDITALHVKTLARTLISNTFYQFYMGGR
jgi:uncharacterized Zn finger protein